MFKFRNVFFGLATALFLIGCNSKDEFKTTADGVQYKVVEEGNGVKVDSGKVAEILISQYLETADSIYQEMKFPGAQGAEIQNPSQNPMLKAFMLGKVGDSLTIKIPNTGQLRKMTPPNLPDSAWLRMEIRILSVEEKETYEARKKKEMEEKILTQESDDDTAIQAYMKANGIENAQKTESGLYYVITEEGNGEKPEVGGEVEVHYTGTLLDGTKFDSSVDRDQTFKFPLGMGRVIPGWDEGIALLSKGSKGVLLIPSHLGYGARGGGAKIPPFTPLKFDVELISFSPAPEKEEVKK
jgi:FKBP-type peptidyl-prolyl cis-trans isomerase FkpA